MNNITVFNHEQFGQIRTLTMPNGQIGFVGKDVATVLGYSRPLDALQRHVDEDDSVKYGLTDSLGRTQQTIIINESGLYALILSSKLPQAKQFTHWLTSEVLPSIRKHGLYATDTVLKSLLDDPEKAIELFHTIKVEREEKEQEDVLSFIHQSGLDDDLDSLSLIRKIITHKEPVKIEQIADDYGVNKHEFCQLLAKKNIIHKVAGVWVPYSKFEAEGAVQKNTVTYSTNGRNLKKKSFFLWTQKGRVMIYERLKGVSLY